MTRRKTSGSRIDEFVENFTVHWKRHRSQVHVAITCIVVIAQLVSAIPFAPPVLASTNTAISPENEIISSLEQGDAGQNMIPLSDGASLAAASSESAAAPLSKTIPADLQLETSRYFLNESERLTVTLRLQQQVAGQLNDVEVNLQLPGSLDVVSSAGGKVNGNKIIWSLANETGNAAFLKEIVLQAKKSNDKQYKIQAELKQNGSPSKKTTLKIAKGNKPKGALVLLDDTVMAQGVTVSIVPFASASPAPQATNTTISAPLAANDLPTESTNVEQPDASVKLLLPLIQSSSNPETQISGSDIQTHTGQVETVAPQTSTETGTTEVTTPSLPLSNPVPIFVEENLTAFAAWHITAQQNGVLTHTLSEPATLILDVRDLAASGLNVKAFGLWTRSQEGEAWHLVKSDYHAEEQIIVAETDHFSDWSLGEDLNSSNHLLPSLQGFASDLNSGNATASVPFDAPSGPGGLSPHLALSYSSGSSAALHSGPDTGIRYGQGDWAGGVGWGLSGLSYVYRDFSINSHPKFLVLNGSSFRLVETSPGNYRTDPETFYEVSGNDWTWTVRTPDGMEYYFGAAMSLRDYMNSSTVWDVWSRSYLSKITDPLGNTVDYLYDAESDCIPRGYAECGHSAEPYTGPGGDWERRCGLYLSLPITGNYTRALYLREVRWGGNSKVNSSHTFRMKLDRVARPDAGIKIDPCDQAQFSAEQLKTVQVQVCLQLDVNATSSSCNPDDASRWHVIRTYDLTYHPLEANTAYWFHSLLTSVSEKGKGGSAALRTYSFSYRHPICNNPANACGNDWQAQRPFLYEASNGWGGKVTYLHSTNYFSVDCRSATNNNDCSPDKLSYPIERIVYDNGLGNFATTDINYIGVPQVNRKDTAENVFLGYTGVTLTVRALTTDGNVIKLPGVADAVTPAAEKIERHYFLTRSGEGANDVHPGHGKVERMDIFLPNNLNDHIFHQYNYWNFGSTNGVQWVRLERQGEISYGVSSNGVRRGETQAWVKGYIYDGYGRTIEVGEYDGWPNSWSNPTNLTLLRKTVTDYTGNVHVNGTNTYILATPSRVRILDANGNCKSESRTIYWDPDISRTADNNKEGNYQSTPWSTLPAKTEQAFKNCDDLVTIDKYNLDWGTSRFQRDAYGNVTASNKVGIDAATSFIMETKFDPFYNLFPIEQWRNEYGTTGFKEYGYYYGIGVGHPSVDDTHGGYWGAMAEYCVINEVCTRQSYDQFGRATNRWDNVVKGSAWESEGTGRDDADGRARYYNGASVEWHYRDPQNNAGFKHTSVTEWRNPRCDGNFKRSLYDGMGQLVAEQTPQQDWTITYEGCYRVQNLAEIDTLYGYNGSGQTVKSSVPISTTNDWVARINTINWTTVWSGIANNTTTYDALGRTLIASAPDGTQTHHYYLGRETRVVGNGNAAPSSQRMQQWLVNDALGNLNKVRTGRWDSASASWLVNGEVTLSHDVMGNLLQVDHAANSGTVSMSYDLAGRKTSMNDPDMGQWSYGYDRLGRLSWQVDACGNRTDIAYDTVLGRISSKLFTPGGNCGTPTSTAYTLNYNYDQNHSSSQRSRGQLTNVNYSTGSYSKTLSYNEKGLLASEAVYITGATQPYTTTYGYDSWNRRNSVTYPDGETVTTRVNSMGLDASLHSTSLGMVASEALYDEAGRPTTMRLGSTQWRKQTYYPWTTPNKGNGGIASIQVSTVNGGWDLLSNKRLNLRNYYYNAFADITAYQDHSNAAVNFKYDDQDRLLAGYYQTSEENLPQYNYTYDSAGRITSYEGIALGNDGVHPHALRPLTATYTYDANGNLANRNGQLLQWDPENRLAKVTNSNGYTETYLYDADGQRIKKTVSGIETFYLGASVEISKSTILPSQIVTDTVWFDDSYPLSTTISTWNTSSTSWSWATSSPTPQSGTKSLRTNSSSLERFHGFLRTASTDNNEKHYSYVPFEIKKNDTLYAWVRLDPTNMPTSVGFVAWWIQNPPPPPGPNDPLAWLWDWGYSDYENSYSGATAYWGEPMWLGGWYTGTLPVAGEWVRLEVPASAISLEGKNLGGFYFRIKGGKANFDRVGKFRPTPPGNQPLVVESVTKYYTFNGQRIAMQRTDGVSGTSKMYYLHTDHLGSVVSVTDAVGTLTPKPIATDPTVSQRYYAYGKTRIGGNLPTDYTFTGQKQDSTGLMYFNARYFDPQIGAFISPDTLIPDASHLLSYNRYMYAFGNPMRYTDPSGHCPWCFTAAIGAVIGGTVTGATYMLTTDYAQWNGGDIATVVGAGAIAGGLMGSGVGIAAGTAQMSAALATAASAAVASGTGAGVTAEVYMATNKMYGQQFDRSDFIVSTGTAAVEGAVNSMIPGSGLAAGTTRAAISAGFGSADYLARNHFNGADGQSTVSGAVRAGAIWGAGSAAGDLLGGGFSSPDPSLLRNPITARDMTFTVWHNQLNSKLIREGISKEAKNALRPFARNFAGLLWITATDKEAQE